MKKILALVAALSVVMSVVAGGSIAYLSDTDSDKNTMTMGKVEIEQIENQLADDGVTLEPFEQDKDLLPGTDVSKIVSVMNTGKTDAYFRTLIAFEDLPGSETFGVNFPIADPSDYTWSWGQPEATIVIDGTTYQVYEALYKKVLKAGETSPASLTKVELAATCTNEDMDALGGTYEVLVLSQAVQTAGFDDAQTALDTAFGDVTNETAAEWFGAADEESKKVPFEGTDKVALVNAINEAKDGAILVLQDDVKIAGYAATEKLVIEKNVTLDLNGKTLTTESGWGGIDLKGGASIINGTINHTGNTAAIKAFQVGKIENVTINVTETAGKTKGGIVVQEGAGCYVGSIKNVTINGATNGIETNKCGSRSAEYPYAIGSMENVKINATDTGLLLSAPVGTATNCEFKGGNAGINAYLYGPYSVALDLVDCEVSGATGLYAHDEVGKTNPGSLTITYDADTTFNGDIKQEFEAEVSGRASVTQK